MFRFLHAADVHLDSPLVGLDRGADLRILAFLTDAEPVHAILRHLRLPATPPPLCPARGPRQLTLDFGHVLDQTSAFDPAEPETIPGFAFDQTRGA